MVESYLSNDDFDRAVRTVWGEASGEPPEGQRAVAAVIANRARSSGKSLSDVVLAPNQFEPWSSRRSQLEKLDPGSPDYQRIAQTIRPVLTGEVPDPTGGATHFYSPATQAALGRKPPSWDNGSGFDIGGHRFFNLGYGDNSTPRQSSTPTPPPSGRSSMADPDPYSDYSGPSQKEIDYKRQMARDLFADSQQYRGGRRWGALAMALAGALSGYEENQASAGDKARQAFGQRLMRDYNDAGRPEPAATSPLVGALAGGPAGSPTSPAVASGSPLPAGPGSMPQNGAPPATPGGPPAASAPVPATAPSSTAPGLSGPRPGFANTPGAMDTDRERRQEAILARAATMEGPVGDWARQQMSFVNQKKLAFGLEHEKAQIGKQLALEQAQEQQKQQINDMVTWGILTPEQGRQALARMAAPQPGTAAAASPSGPAASLPPPAASSAATAAPPAAPISLPGTVVANSPPPALASPSPQPLTPGGQMPPGTRPSGLPAQDDMTAAMPPLSENAQRAQKMIEYGMMKGNRAMVQAGNDLLNADPTQEARKKQAEKMGVNAANLAERRRAGTNVEKTFDHFEQVTKEMRSENPKAFDNAIGRINSAGYGIGDTLQTVRGAVMGLPGVGLTNNYAQGADYHNRMDHLIDGLTTAFMASAAGSGLQMSDSRMAKFEQTMGAMRRASTPKEFDRIMGDARKIIRDVFSLDDGHSSVDQAAPPPGAGVGIPTSIAYQPSGIAVGGQGAAPSMAAAPTQTAAPRANFAALPNNEKRSAVAELAADLSPKNQENFRKIFGDEGLATALSIIQEQKAALSRPPTMPNPLSNFDASGRFTGAR